MAATGRHGARRLLVQALYQHQIGGHAVDQLVDQYSSSPGYDGIDTEYFLTLLDETIRLAPQLDERIAAAGDRSPDRLDPVERAVLWLGFVELEYHDDVPVAVVVNEAVELARQFGAQDGYRFVNAVLDSAAADLRDRRAG